MTVEEILAKKHPLYKNQKRGALELALRDAYAAGANAGKTVGFPLAMDYAERAAPIVAEMLCE